MIWIFIKTTIFFGIALVCALFFNLVEELEGSILISFYSREYQLSFVVFISLILVILALLSVLNFTLNFLLSLVGFLRGDDTALKRFFDKRAERKGNNFLIRAFTSSFEGDHRRALIDITQSKKYLKSKSLSNILSLASYEATGELKEQEKVYQELISDKATRSMGLFGLIKMKLSEGNTDLALKLTNRLIKIKPFNLSFNKTLFNLQLIEKDWKGALESFKKINKIKRVNKDSFLRGESTLLFMQAKALRRDGILSDALKVSKQAFKKFPGLVPNSIFLSELELVQGQKRKAESVLISTWRVIPHPEVAKSFAKIEKNESKEQRLERFQKVLNLKKNDFETKMLKAELNIMVENFPDARRAISDVIESENVNARALTLMAAIEKGSGSSESTVESWLAKAVTAKRSKRWICSNCDKESEWVPICKKCGEFSSLEWTEEVNKNFENDSEVDMLPLIIRENKSDIDIQLDKDKIDDKKVADVKNSV